MSDIAGWLERLGLGKYTRIFAEHEVDFEVVQRLSEDDLRELGLPLGARKKILQAASEIRERGPTTPLVSAGRHDPASVTGPERRQITVMFSDVVGSTLLAEQVDVEDLRSLVLAYQQACAAAIERWGGHVAQYLGDGVLAYFGYPQGHEDDAVRAVRAALLILENMHETNTRLLSQHGVGLEVRVGVHTGLVVAGEMGAGGTREQLAVGETPNVAARIQGLASPGTVVVSDATWHLVDGFFTAELLGPHALKGVSRPTAIYRILAPTGLANPFEARVARSLTPLVSRELELGFLQKRWEQAHDSEGQVVLVQGEAGIGKSRLMRAFREHLTQADYHAITLHGSSHHQASAFHPIVDQLSRVLEFVPQEGHVARQNKVSAFIERLALPADQLVPALAALLGVVTDHRVPGPPTESDQLRRMTFDALVQIVTALSRERPLLFVVEDAHWIDPSTQELIGHVADAIRDCRVMAVLTARPEYRAPWAGLAHFSMLSVSRLSRRETEAMIRRVANVPIPPEVLAQLVSRADGVPLYIEELTKSVLGMLGGAAASASAVPATLQEALTARLDRLAPVRELIQVAALLGRVFDAEMVQAVTALDRVAVERALAELTDAGLIYHRLQQHHAVFEFKHALIQEAALNTLVRSRRALLHGRIVDALERIRPELGERQPELVAHHLQEAGDDRRAWTFWRAAGELAAQRSASREAVKHFTYATECLKRLGPARGSLEDEAATYLGLATALMKTEGYRSEKLAVAADAAQRAAQVAGDLLLQWRIWLDTAPVFYGTGRNGEYLAAVAELDQGSLSHVDTGLRAGLLITRGIAHFNRGEYLDADGCFATVIDLLSESHRMPRPSIGGGDAYIVVRSYAARTSQRLGRLEQALQIGLAAVRVGRSLDDAFSLAWAIHIRGAAYRHVGNYQALFADAEECITISRRHGFSARLSYGLMGRGIARAHLGELDEGIEDVREGRGIWRATGAVFHAAEHVVELTDLLLVAGRVAEAAALLDDVDTLVGGTDEAACLAECQRVRGMIAAASGDVAGAEAWFEMAIATARVQGARLFELRATTRLADLLATRRRTTDVLRRLDEICALFTEGNQAPDLQAAEAMLLRLRS